MNCTNPCQYENPVDIENCITWDDSVNVLDNYNYSDNGKLKPPCSLSPDYWGCIESRKDNL